MTGTGSSNFLETVYYFVAILVPSIGGVYWLYQARLKAIQKLTADLARAWTNEGDVSGTELLFVTLHLKFEDGDLYGSLESNAYNRDLEAHVDAGWGTAKLHVSELMGKALLPVGKVILKLNGKRNRIAWKLVGMEGSDRLPISTTLWPDSTKA